MKTKICSKCKQEKPVTDFYRNKWCPDGYYYQCKVCKSEYSKAYRQKNLACTRAWWKKSARKNKDHIREKDKEYRRANQERIRKDKLERNFGITPEEYDRMLAEQKGCCAICGRPRSDFKKRLAVDHDHETGKIRGLLCPRCNIKLGVLDNKLFIEQATAYLRR